MSENNNSFNYTYSSAEQKEIEAIRKKYTDKPKSAELSKLEQLRKLDNSVTSKATTVSLVVGIISALVMGFGMSLVMTDLAKTLGIANPMLVGIVVGVIGMFGVISAYPLYQFTLKKEREKVAPQVLKLTDELSEK